MVYLVEVSSVDQLVDRLKKGKFKTYDSVRAQSEFATCFKLPRTEITMTGSGQKCGYRR